MTSDPRPFYRLHTFVCTTKRPADDPHPSCGQRGSDPLRDYLKTRVKDLGQDAEIRINGAACMGRCGLGPVMVIYPEGVWYTFSSNADIDEILDTHLLKGGRVERLMLQPEDVPPQVTA
jgi:(2Fe-2S) ferredoxin